LINDRSVQEVGELIVQEVGELIVDVTVPEDGDQHVVKKMKMSEWVFYLLILK
jgi:hypothetical protein